MSHRAIIFDDRDHGESGVTWMIGTDVWNGEILTAGLGVNWTLERIGLKPYACCRHAHAVIDAARMCMRNLAITPGDITEIATYALLKQLHRCPDVRAIVSQFRAVK